MPAKYAHNQRTHVVHSGDDPEQIAGAMRDDDIRADCIHDIDRFGLPRLPRPRLETVRLRSQRAHRTQVDDVARQFRSEHLLHVGADLQLVASACRAEVGHSGHLIGEAHATRALDATRHHRLHQGTQVLVLHRAAIRRNQKMGLFERHLCMEFFGGCRKFHHDLQTIRLKIENGV